jgi:FkbM family methyltransferase
MWNVLPDAAEYGGSSVTVDNALTETVESRYGQIAIFINDVSSVSRALTIYGEWAQNEITFMRHFVPEGATVLDVGAYIGTHALAFAQFTGPSGRILAFEAQPHAFDMLRRNVAANDVTHVECRNVVVADFDGTVAVPSIDIDQQGSYGSASLRGQLHPDESELADGAGQRQPRLTDVAAITIDSLDLADCALIKIDAEGTEDVVLRGARATIARLKPTIYAECNAIGDGLRSIAILRDLNYEVRAHVVDAFDPENFNGASENIFDKAKEVALVGVPAGEGGRLDAIPVRPCELLLRIETADDLALALLNKPQYPDEILVGGAAAKSGGACWLEQLAKDRSDHAAARGELEWARQALAEERARAASIEPMLAKEREAARAIVEGMANERDDAAARAQGVVQAMAKERDDAVARAEAMVEGIVKERDEATARAQAIVDGMAQERDEAVARAEAMQAVAGRLASERDAAQAAAEAMERERDAALAHAAAAMHQARAARAALDAAETMTVQTSEQAARTLEALRSGHHEELRKLRDTNESRVRAMEAQIGAMYASTSWRFARPVRLLGRLLRGRA